MVQVVLQASAGHKVLYTGPVQSLVHWCQVSQAMHKCGKLRNRNCGLHGALLGWVVKAVRNGRAHFRTVRNFARVAAKVRNMSCLSR